MQDRRNYSIGVEASVAVVDAFQMRFENISDNSDTVSPNYYPDLARMIWVGLYLMHIIIMILLFHKSRLS